MREISSTVIDPAAPRSSLQAVDARAVRSGVHHATGPGPPSACPQTRTCCGKVSRPCHPSEPEVVLLWQGLPTLPPHRTEDSAGLPPNANGRPTVKDVGGVRRPSPNKSDLLWQGLPTLPPERPVVARSPDLATRATCCGKVSRPCHPSDLLWQGLPTLPPERPVVARSPDLAT